MEEIAVVLVEVLAVVAGEDYEGALLEAVLAQGLEERSHLLVHERHLAVVEIDHVVHVRLRESEAPASQAGQLVDLPPHPRGSGAGESGGLESGR